jgi:hypothetical protein
VSSGGQEYKVRQKGNVRGKRVMIKNVYYVPCLEKNLLLISSIMKHRQHLLIFNDNMCFIAYNNNKNMVTRGVEEQGVFWLLEVENVELVRGNIVVTSSKTQP